MDAGRGGWRQRLARRERERERSRSPRFARPFNKIVGGHLYDWGVGQTSAMRLKEHLHNVEVQDCARRVPSEETLLRYARIGGRRPRSNTCHRDLLKLVTKDFSFMALARPVGPGSCYSFYIPSHLLAHEMSVRYPDRLIQYFGLDPVACLDFWVKLKSSAVGERFWEQHKLLRGRRPHDLRHTVPLALHEDSGPFSKNASVSVVSISSLLGQGPELACKWPCLLRKKERGAAGITPPDDPAWRMVLRSIYLMYIGYGDFGHEPFCVGQYDMVVYDKDIVSYTTLLEVFFSTHDPTTLNQQGNDRGTQYRSAIFCTDEAEVLVANNYIKKLTSGNIFQNLITTEVSLLIRFYEAEIEHKDYYDLNSNQPYCNAVISPKIKKLIENNQGLLK